MAQELAIIITLTLCQLLLYSLTSAQQASWVDSKCGEVVIPFPFHMKSSNDCSKDHLCSYMDDWFEIECRDNQTPFLKSISMEVKEIDIENNTITVMNPIYPCQLATSIAHLNWSPFLYTRTNILIIYRCKTPQSLLPQNTESAVCFCIYMDWKGDHYNCNGMYCCQTRLSLPLPMVLSELNISIVNAEFIEVSFHSDLPCDFLVIGDPNWLYKPEKNYSRLFNRIKDSPFVPAVLDWGIPLISTPFSMLQNVKDCHDYTLNTSAGVQLLRRSCQCPLGIRGNPYIDGGCIGDNSGERKRQTLARIIIGLEASLGSIFLLISGRWLYKIIKKRRAKNLKEKYFKQNGGLLLQQKLSSSHEFNVDMIKLFRIKDLEEATNHFNMDRVLGKGGQGTVYKGMLTNGKIVAVKKQKVQGNVEDFINEIVILAQINHRNVVKLLGCCLEAKFPLLVYEFISNGTLFYHLHEDNEELSLTWDMRLRIAIEVAGALFYLHSAASQPIYHRDIKSTNILLDEKYRAKVGDFGASKLVPNIEATHITTKVHGTFGYLDPEYYYTGQLTGKSDVYSFGVVLVELLTGQKAVSSTGSDGYARSLASQFTTCMDENCLLDILDASVLKEGDKEHLMVIAKLAKRCLSLNGKERPTMGEVTIELAGIQNLREKSNDNHVCRAIDLVKIDTYTPRDIKRSASLNLDFISNSETSSSSDVQPLLFSTYP